MRSVLAPGLRDVPTSYISLASFDSTRIDGLFRGKADLDDKIRQVVHGGMIERNYVLLNMGSCYCVPWMAVIVGITMCQVPKIMTATSLLLSYITITGRRKETWSDCS